MKFLRQIIIVITLTTINTVSSAALPVAVNGQPLPSLAPMLERVQESVVSINSDVQRRVRSNRFYDDPFFKRFFEQTQGSGSQNRQATTVGVVVDAANGYILTNEHSIEGATNIMVTFPDGEEVPARVVGVDKVADVAVIQVDKANLTEVATADSDVLRVGDFVVSIGDPLGSQNKITSGLISALSNQTALKNHQHFIQSDAGYGPGILVNLHGEMIGLNISRVAQTSRSVRIGFSTPINLAVRIKQQIIEFGAPQRGFLAVQTQDLTPELASVLNIFEERGVVITRVAKGSNAEQSGVQVGDVVLKVENQFINRSNDLRSLVGYHFAGDTLDMNVLRKGSKITLSPVLESSTKVSKIDAMIHHKLDGATFKEISINQGGSIGSEGVLAANVQKGSIAWNNGMRANDLIVSANRREVSNLDEFRTAINNKEVLMLNIVRDNGALFLLLQ